MMKTTDVSTPICDFVQKYARSSAKRMHMPGHKGVRFLGCEPLDITEIHGADVLYDANGIIAESEDNATALFGTAHTYYSTEGSSLSIKAMLALAAYDGDFQRNKRLRPYVLASRNVHKSFIYACALLDIDVEFLAPSTVTNHICACGVTPADVAEILADKKTLPRAVYVTSPDYLGNILDIKGIADACHLFNVPLLVDNAHGAYLAFTEKNMHPITLGADMCCDSAHKTLPALTGAGYLHISKNASPAFARNARSRLALFASTSPSYLILQSLDLCNKYLAEEGKYTIPRMERQLSELKFTLRNKGFTFIGDEPLKLTLDLSDNKLSAPTVAEYMRLHFSLECEYCDKEYLVLMLSPQNGKSDLNALESALLSVPLEKKTETKRRGFKYKFNTERNRNIREAVFAPHETVHISEALGRICASPTVSCPPAVPIAITGEIINENTLRMLEYYEIREIDVVIEQI